MTFTSPCLIIWCSWSNSLYQKTYFHILCYFDMNQPRHFSLPSYSCLYFSLWSNCDSKDMPLNFHDQIWPHISFPASHFYPPPQATYLAGPAVSLSSIFRHLQGQLLLAEAPPSLSSDYSMCAQLMLLEQETKCWDRLQGIQTVYCFSARPSEGEAKRRHKNVYVCLLQQFYSVRFDQIIESNPLPLGTDI